MGYIQYLCFVWIQSHTHAVLLFHCFISFYVYSLSLLSLYIFRRWRNVLGVGVKGSFLLSLGVTWKDNVAIFVLYFNYMASVPSACHSKRNVCMCAAAFCVTWMGMIIIVTVFQMNFIWNKLICMFQRKKHPLHPISVSACMNGWYSATSTWFNELFVVASSVACSLS